MVPDPSTARKGASCPTSTVFSPTTKSRRDGHEAQVRGLHPPNPGLARAHHQLSRLGSTWRGRCASSVVRNSARHASTYILELPLLHTRARLVLHIAATLHGCSTLTRVCHGDLSTRSVLIADDSGLLQGSSIAGSATSEAADTKRATEYTAPENEPAHPALGRRY